MTPDKTIPFLCLLNQDSAMERLRSRARDQKPSQVGKMTRSQGRGSCPRRRASRRSGLPGSPLEARGNDERDSGQLESGLNQ